MRFSGEFPSRKRDTPGEHDSFQQKPPEEKREVDEEAAHKELRRQHAILGCLLWLATRSRPDLAFVTARACGLVSRELQSARTKTKHALQHLSSHQAMGLLYFWVEMRRRKFRGTYFVGLF